MGDVLRPLRNARGVFFTLRADMKLKNLYFLLFLFLLGLPSCRSVGQTERSTRDVETYNARTDTLRTVQLIRDSIYHRDSIYIVRETIGDTVYITKHKERWRTAVCYKRDTVYRMRTDTVRVNALTTERQAITKRRGVDVVAVIFLVFIIVAVWFVVRYVVKR